MCNGVLILDKPRGPSTAMAVRAVASRCGGVKAGHAGTLDPLADGLIIALFGKATKLSRYFTALDKTYLGRLRLGERTNTGDGEGYVVERKFVEVTFERLHEISRELTGEQKQLPPAFSAVKYRGKPLYKYARKGIEVPVKPRRVRVEKLEIEEIDLPEVELTARVSSGTYIRSLAEEIGRRSGCGAHLLSLRRTAVGKFSEEGAIGLNEAMKLAGEGELEDILLSPSEALYFFPEVEVDSETALRITHGERPDLGKSGSPGDIFKIVHDRELVAVAAWEDIGYSFERVMMTPESIEN